MKEWGSSEPNYRLELNQWLWLEHCCTLEHRSYWHLYCLGYEPLQDWNNSQRICKRRFGLSTELKVFWSAISGRSPLLGLISGSGFDPDGCLVQWRLELILKEKTALVGLSVSAFYNIKKFYDFLLKYFLCLTGVRYMGVGRVSIFSLQAFSLTSRCCQ